MPPDALRGGRRAGRRADPRRRAREGRARARGRGPRADRPRPGAVLGVLREALPVVLRVRRRPRRRRRSSAPPPSCSSAARASAPAPSRWRARRGAAPIRRSTTTSASSCCAATRTARRTRSSRARIARALRPHAVWVTAAPEPVADQGREHPAPRPPRSAPSWPTPVGAIELAGALHPTPAVGGEPDRRGRAADPGARGPRSRLVRRPGRLDRRRRRRRVLRRAALRAAARRDSRPATRAAGSCATPTRPRSWPRPRSSCRRCCRSSPAESARGSAALPRPRAVQRDGSRRGRCGPR